MAEIIHQYFKKELPDLKILVQIDPKSWRGTELIIEKGQKIKKTKRQFDPEILEDLEADEFTSCSPLEFNIYLKGLAL